MNNHIQKEGRGVLFQNLDKKTEAHPDYKGQVMFEGKVIFLSAWKKTHSHGHLFSLSVVNNLSKVDEEKLNKNNQVDNEDM